MFSLSAVKNHMKLYYHILGEMSLTFRNLEKIYVRSHCLLSLFLCNQPVQLVKRLFHAAYFADNAFGYGFFAD